MNGSRKKRVSWFFDNNSDSQEEEGEQLSQQNNEVNAIPQSQLNNPPPIIQIQPQQDPDIVNPQRTRKVSFIPFNRGQQQTPQKLSVISEEQGSSKQPEVQQPIEQESKQKLIKSIQKPIQLMQSIVETPQQQFRTPKINNLEEGSIKLSNMKSIKTSEFDINRELISINQLIEMNDTTLKKINQREEQEITNLQGILYEKIQKLQQKLFQLNEIEQRYLDQQSQYVPLESFNQQNIQNLQNLQVEQVKQQKSKGTSSQIRQVIVKCLGYKMKSLIYQKNQYQMIIEYPQAEIMFVFRNQKNLDSKSNISEIFGDFIKELRDNKLMLTQMKVDYYKQSEIPKSDILQASLKIQFQNSSRLPNEIIRSAIHQMPLLLQKIDQLERELIKINSIWGSLWKLDIDVGLIYILIGYRFKLNEKFLQNQQKKKIFRFELNLKNFEIQYHFLQYFEEIIFPFLSKESKRRRSNPEITFGEQLQAVITNKHTEIIEQFLFNKKPTLTELIEWLNVMQFN